MKLPTRKKLLIALVFLIVGLVWFLAPALIKDLGLSQVDMCRTKCAKVNKAGRLVQQFPNMTSTSRDPMRCECY